MNLAQQLVFLAEQAWGAVAYMWPVSLGLLILAVAAVLADVIRKRIQVSRSIALLALPLCGPVAILVVGVLFEMHDTMESLPLFILAVVFVLCAWIVYRLRKSWMTAVACSLLVLWCSLCCAFVSGMSITGDWL